MLPPIAMHEKATIQQVTIYEHIALNLSFHYKKREAILEK